MNESNSRARAQALAMGVAVVAFVVLFVAASQAYPGGTHFDHASVGHDFWRNSLCDVARTVAIGGAPNVCAANLARAAMTILALGLGVLFVALPHLFLSNVWLGRVVRTLGIASVPFSIAVVLLPTDRFSFLHGVAIVFAGALGIGAVLFALKGLLAASEAPGIVVALGVLTASVAAVDFLLYVAEFLSGGPPQVAVPILERIATILVLAWMVAVASTRTRTRSASG